MSNTLNDKQKKFCDEYVIDSNGTQAAIRAGYSKKTANEIARKLLTKVDIKSYISELQADLARRCHITQDMVLKEYAKIAFLDPRKIFDDNGRVLDIYAIDAKTAGAIAGIEIDRTVKSGDEEASGIVINTKIKFLNKNGALDSICRMLGWNAADKVDLTTKGKELPSTTTEIKIIKSTLKLT